MLDSVNQLKVLYMVVMCAS